MTTNKNYTRELKDNAMRGFSYIGLILLPVVTYLSFSMNDTVLGILQITYWVILALNLTYINKAEFAKFPALVILLPLFSLLIYIIIYGSFDLIYWVFVLPVISFFLLNLNTGMLINVVFTIILGVVMIFETNYFKENTFGATTILITYVTIFSVSYLMERYRNKILDQLRITSYADFLTGVGNRRRFQHNLEQQINITQRHKRPFSLLLLDADHFKAVNDTYGHPAGDQVLIDLVGLVKTILRNEDGLYRVGGEEFAIILPETSIEGAIVIAERIRSGIATQNFDHDITITVSIGLVDYYEGAKVEDLFQAADRALYNAKKSGRDCVEIFQAIV